MKFIELFNTAYKYKYQYTKGVITYLKYGKQICEVLTEFENSNKEPFAGFNGTEDITPVICWELINIFRSKGNKESTIQRKLNVLSGILTFAIENNLIEHKIKVPKLKVGYVMPIYFLPKDKNALINYFEKTDRKMYIYCVFAFKTGVRIGNIVALNDTNFVNGDIVINETKNGERLELPMTDEIKTLADELKELGYFEGWNDQHIRYRFKKAIKILGLNSDYTPHKARHTFTTDISASGTRDDVGKELTGHKSDAMYKHYNHYNKRKEKLEALSRL